MCSKRTKPVVGLWSRLPRILPASADPRDSPVLERKRSMLTRTSKKLDVQQRYQFSKDKGDPALGRQLNVDQGNGMRFERGIGTLVCP